MAESNLEIPIAAGSAGYPTGSGTQGNRGFIEMVQKIKLVQNGTSTVSGTIYVPYSAGAANSAGTYYAQISEIWADVAVLWNSGTSATLSVGKTAGGTEFASLVDVKSSAVRVIPSFTAAQLANLLNVGQNSIVATVTPVGTAATTGTVYVYVRYTVGTSLNPTPTI